MKFLEDLEGMENSVEITEESEKHFENNFDTLDEFYGRCEDIKSQISTLRELEMIGEDIEEAMSIVLSELKNLIEIGKTKFDLSEDDVESIEKHVTGKGHKIR